MHDQGRGVASGGGNAAPSCVFAPRFISCPSPTVFFGEEKVAVFGRKKRLNLWFRPEKAFGFRRRPSFFFFFFLRSPDFGRKKRLSLLFRPKKAFGFQRSPFFFWDHLIFTETLSQSNSGIMKKLCPPDFNFAPPPPRSREAGVAPGPGAKIPSI